MGKKKQIKAIYEAYEHDLSALHDLLGLDQKIAELDDALYDELIADNTSGESFANACELKGRVQALKYAMELMHRY